MNYKYTPITLKFYMIYLYHSTIADDIRLYKCIIKSIYVV